ncbi:MAG TPA: O-methyltransferase [Longimicrobiaceae bacterium]|jgi:predicted O-methyltransferase YrrM|nr:O-methyltransferase [Longimicrobiaceae bacterium]
MNEDVWNRVDDYFCGMLLPADEVLDAAAAASDAAGIPSIQVAPNQGMLLHLLAAAQGARTILEIGTLSGYSTIWLARALPHGGRLVTLEIDPLHAEVARGNFERAGLSEVVELRLGPALETLPQLAAEGLGPFDLIFIDADKANIPAYFTWALRLARRGTMIIVDNVVRDGEVVDAQSDDAAVQGVRRFVEMAAAEPRVKATVVQTVGVKGYDGLAFVLVTEDAPESA